jgi:diguanylate cyclase (GGDEF)-like protein
MTTFRIHMISLHVCRHIRSLRQPGLLAISGLPGRSEPKGQAGVTARSQPDGSATEQIHGHPKSRNGTRRQDQMNRKGADNSRRGNATDGVSTAWVNEVELNSRMMQETARRVGLGRSSGTVRLSLDSIDRRRFQIWILTVGLLFLIFVSMALVGGHLETVLNIGVPDWLPRTYVIVFMFVLTLLYGVYVFEKENQLRKLTRYLIDEQFQTDVVNRRLKIVGTLLESSKAVNGNMGEAQVLDVISRQTGLFFEDSEVCLYLSRDEKQVKAASGNRQLGLEGLASMVITRNQSQFAPSTGNDASLDFGVPITASSKVLGALCMRVPKANLDTFETLMALALFAEQAAAAIANSRSRERERIDESRLEYAIAHDNHTGLLNRDEFIARVDGRIAQFGDQAPRIALMFMNIDDFHRINNSLGYEAGDAVIRHYADVLNRIVPDDAYTGHFGGDEFMIALPGISGYAELMDLTHSLRTHLDESLTIGNRKISITSSIGIAMPETFETNAHTLIRDAHIAMQEAKKAGGAAIIQFDSSLIGDADRALDLEQDLKRALEQDEISISLQPIFDLDHTAPVAIEALVRWVHPEHGVLPASSFLPFAGQSGQLTQIDQRVFQKSCAAIRGLRDHGFDLPMHANLFPGYLKSRDLIPGVKRILDAAGIEPDSFVIEISDTDLLLGSQQVVDNLNRLREMGFGIALDDFGSGASGLDSLNRAPIDTVKISRDFISSLGSRDDPHREMVETIISLADRLDLEVIAVGIENDHQVEMLREIGCHLAQGNFLGKPLQLKKFIERYGDVSQVAMDAADDDR